MRHPDPEGLPPSGVPPDTGGPLAGCFPHLGRPCGGQYRRMNCPSGAIPGPVHWPLHPLRANDKWNRPGRGRSPSPPFIAIQPTAVGWLLGLRPPSPAGLPPSRLAARQGFGVNRSFRAASAVPSGALGRPLPARPFGRLSALLCSGLPLGPVGPAPPSASWARSRVGRGAFRRGRRGLAALWRLAALLRLCRPRLRRPAWPPFSFPGFVSVGGAGGLCALAGRPVTRYARPGRAACVDRSCLTVQKK